MKANRWINRALNVLLTGIGVVILYFLIRIFMFDTFPVNSDSMAPTIQPGDKIGVNKMIFGTRLYKNLDFFDGMAMESWRVPGFREIRHNDIVVFNHVRNKEKNQIRFNFGTVFVKRCVGLPGDTLSIVNGFYQNTNASSIDLGIKEQLERLNSPDTLSLKSSAKGALKYTRPEYNWTIFDLGPLYIPKAGSSIELDTVNYKIYQLAIEFETDQPLTCRDGRVFLANREIRQYTFLKNYYFMAGDHALNSNDSRYWGYVPEEFIIGVVPRLWTSHDPHAGKMNWKRAFKRLNR